MDNGGGESDHVSIGLKKLSENFLRSVCFELTLPFDLIRDKKNSDLPLKITKLTFPNTQKKSIIVHYSNTMKIEWSMISGSILSLEPKLEDVSTLESGLYLHVLQTICKIECTKGQLIPDINFIIKYGEPQYTSLTSSSSSSSSTSSSFPVTPSSSEDAPATPMTSMTSLYGLGPSSMYVFMLSQYGTSFRLNAQDRKTEMIKTRKAKHEEEEEKMKIKETFTMKMNQLHCSDKLIKEKSKSDYLELFATPGSDIKKENEYNKVKALTFGMESSNVLENTPNLNLPLPINLPDKFKLQRINSHLFHFIYDITSTLQR